MIDDTWLIDRAEKKKADDAFSRRNAPLLGAKRLASFTSELDTLWAELQAETRRQAGVYNTALDEPDALVVTTDADALDIRASDGRQLTIRVDRARQSLTEAFRTSEGAVRMGKPRIRFAVTSAGTLAFNFGLVRSAAGSLLRRLID
jgi:hypothetical protein